VEVFDSRILLISGDYAVSWCFLCYLFNGFNNKSLNRNIYDKTSRERCEPTIPRRQNHRRPLLILRLLKNNWI
jgi:hypothetical protein